MSSDRVGTLLDGRRKRIQGELGRALAMPSAGDAPPLTTRSRDHLLQDAVDLYWNEMEWERVTEEEATDGAPLSPLVFPGFLAFVRGLLLREALPDSAAPAVPRPELVEELLRFLAGRVLELEEELGRDDVDESERLESELALTDRLIDHVLHEYHGLSSGEVALLETAGTDD